MSSVGEQIGMDSLLKALQGKDISNLTIMSGNCIDCNHNHSLVYGSRRKASCDLGHRCSDRDPKTFCCVDYDDNKTEEARTRDAK